MGPNSYSSSAHTSLQIVRYETSWKTADWDHILFPLVLIEKAKTNGCRTQLIRDANFDRVHFEFGHGDHVLHDLGENDCLDCKLFPVLLLDTEEWLEVWHLVLSEESAEIS